MATMTNRKQVDVYFAIEFHQLIKVSNVFVTISNPEKLTDIVVTKRYIQVSLRKPNNKNLHQCRFEMPADTFLPASTSGLSGQYFKSPEEHDADHITFKSKPWTQTGPLELTFRIHVNDDVFPDDNSDKQVTPAPIEYPMNIQTEYDFLCRSCKNPLNSTPLVFKRVLDKPSSDWQDLASEWFCHRHSEDDCVPTGIRQTDLMVGSQSVYLHPDLISFKEGSNRSTLCKRCESHLGFLSESRLLNEANPITFSELMTNSIVFKPCDEILCEEEKNKSAIETVVMLIRKQMEPIMMCKLCLESKGPAQSSGSLLLWVMDNTLLRYHTHCTLTSGTRTVAIQPEKVIKALYNLTEGSSSLALQWRKDFSVDTESVDDCTLWTVVDHLIDSTQTLPSAHRALDDLWVGFLPAKESVH